MLKIRRNLRTGIRNVTQWTWGLCRRSNVEALGTGLVVQALMKTVAWHVLKFLNLGHFLAEVCSLSIKTQSYCTSNKLKKNSSAWICNPTDKRQAKGAGRNSRLNVKLCALLFSRNWEQKGNTDTKDGRPCFLDSASGLIDQLRNNDRKEVRSIAGEKQLQCAHFTFDLSFLLCFQKCKPTITVVLLPVPINARPVLRFSFI